VSRYLQSTSPDRCIADFAEEMSRSEFEPDMLTIMYSDQTDMTSAKEVSETSSLLWAGSPQLTNAARRPSIIWVS
jgi:hypothetical protein